MPVLLMCSSICLTSVYAKEFQYFSGRDIDYWGEGKMVSESIFVRNEETTKENNQAYFSGSNPIRSSDTKHFDWNNYKDPSKAEFWDDGGDWIPPRPFREAVANPTKENIKSYLEWMMKKTEMVDKFQIALTSYTSGAPEKQLPKIEQNPKLNKEITKQNARDLNWQKVQIAYFYQTACPHCRSSANVIEEAQNLGANVKFVQLDANKNPPLHENSIPYDENLERDFHVTVTPTWFVKVGSNYTELTGEMNFIELSNVAKQLLDKEIIR